MRIVCLCENTANSADIEAEHGLSLYIEANGVKVLFDMGQTELFARNAKRLGVDLSAVDIAVLSHGHYDHGGGLPHFLEINKKAPVYVNPHAFGEHYNGTEKYIGLAPALKGDRRFIYTCDGMKIADGMTLYLPEGRQKPYPFGAYGLTRKEDGGFIPDEFRHEQYLQIEEKGRRVLFSGCSHNGVANIAEWFSPHVLMGGFHFSKITDADELAVKAAQMKTDCFYYTCHCTGAEQYRELKGKLPCLEYLSCGCDVIV